MTNIANKFFYGNCYLFFCVLFGKICRFYFLKYSLYQKCGYRIHPYPQKF